MRHTRRHGRLTGACQIGHADLLTHGEDDIGSERNRHVRSTACNFTAAADARAAHGRALAMVSMCLRRILHEKTLAMYVMRTYTSAYTALSHNPRLHAYAYNTDAKTTPDPQGLYASAEHLPGHQRLGNHFCQDAHRHRRGRGHRIEHREREDCGRCARDRDPVAQTHSTPARFKGSE